MTPAFRSFVAPARARPQIWRLILGIALAGAIYVGLSVVVFFLAGLAGVPSIDASAPSASPELTLAFIATFAGLAVGTFVVARLLHARGPGTLFGPRVRTLRDFVIAAAAVGVLIALSLAGWSLAYDAEPGLPPERWLRLLPIALVAVLVQTGAEELFFRGYVQQQLAARFASPLAWGVLPAMLFAAGHYDPSNAGPNALLVVGVTALFGLLAADLTARTGSIGAAWGFHFANNVHGLLIVATQGPLSGLALWTTPYGTDDAVLPLVLPIDIAMMLAGWLVVRRLVTLR